MRVLFVRHGSTAWNEAGRIQGCTDVPLSPAGRAQVAGWRLPEGWRGGRCVTSPLQRARETAALLGFDAAEIDARLVEMGWGGYEGATLAELRQRHGDALAENEARGLDFRPPGGESPREVAARLAGFLRDLAVEGEDRLVVAHRGILRASLVLAFGWDMLGRPPVRIVDDVALEHELDSDGGLAFVRSVGLREAAP